MFAYDFQTNLIPGDPRAGAYWRDVGTIDAYFGATWTCARLRPT